MQISVAGVAERLAPPEVPSAPAEAVIVSTASNTGNVDSPGGVVSLDLTPPFALTSENPPGLGTAVGGFDASSSGPLASGSSQRTTTTAAAPVLNACGSPPLGQRTRFPR